MRPRTKKAVLPAPESALPHATLSHDGSAPEAVRLRLLGGFRVSVGSRTVGEEVWRRKKKAAALLKLLALSPGHRMHREQAMELLWPHLGGRPRPTTSTAPSTPPAAPWRPTRPPPPVT